MPKNEAVIRRSLVDQVYKLILSKIQSGELTPGERLNIEELSREFGVSRTPMREAINRLSENDFVESVHNIGPRVKVLSREAITEACEANAVLLDAVSALIFEKGSPDQLADKLDELVAKQRKSHASGDSEGFFDATVGFHEAIIEACPNKTLADITMPTQVRLDSFVLHNLEWDGKPEMSIEDHSRLAILMRAEAADEFRRVLMEHNETPLKFLTSDL